MEERKKHITPLLSPRSSIINELIIELLYFICSQRVFLSTTARRGAPYHIITGEFSKSFSSFDTYG